MPVGEEASRAHAVRIVPDDQVREQHIAGMPQMLNEGEKVAAAGFALVLQAAKNRDIAGRRQYPFGFPKPSARPSRIIVMTIPVGQHDVVRRIAHDQLHGSVRQLGKQIATIRNERRMARLAERFHVQSVIRRMGFAITAHRVQGPVAGVAVGSVHIAISPSSARKPVGRAGKSRLSPEALRS